MKPFPFTDWPHVETDMVAWREWAKPTQEETGDQMFTPLTLADAQAIVDTKTAPKVTKESIEAKIQRVQYIRHDQLTIAIIVMFNGFMVLGKAAPASAANFDAEVGERFAYEDAFKQLWQLEGYLLREKLSMGPL